MFLGFTCCGTACAVTQHTPKTIANGACASSTSKTPSRTQSAKSSAPREWTDVEEPEQAIVEGLKSCGLDADGYDATDLQDIAAVIVEKLGLTADHRRLADGESGMSTNWKTGETTHHYMPQTEMRRWVTPWETTEASQAARAAARRQQSGR